MRVGCPSIARIYGPWHLGITAIQGIAWAAFVYWNESGKQAYWADTAQVVGEKTWAALPAFFITSAIILVIIQKGGRMVLTFVDERRKRIEKARAEALEEAYAKWSDWNRRREESARRGRALRRAAAQPQRALKPYRAGCAAIRSRLILWLNLQPKAGIRNMNHQTNGDENRRHESWLSSIARIYGPWHLGITAIQGIVWAAFVYWNESGKHAYWADMAQVVGEKTWAALPALFITSAIILVVIQKGGEWYSRSWTSEESGSRRRRLRRGRKGAWKVAPKVAWRDMRRDAQKGAWKGAPRVELRDMRRVARKGAPRGGKKATPKWTDWNRRREEAASRGERFDEPPPSLNGR